MSNPNRPIAIGSWTFNLIPPGCDTLEGQGFCFAPKGRAGWSAVVAEDSLGPEATLEQYLDTQARLLQNQFGNVKADPPKPKSVKGAEQGIEITLRLNIQGRNLIQRQVYARSGRTVGVLTFTIDSDLPQPPSTALQNFESALQFLPTAG